ncbi:hypothetical protein AC578_4232 [Pseudocercospora eumusae]|uniref:Uncharacterized protein n=1 Tax=Pseudocercospora eumusae TaxID=321146 RepID=A0A139H388_9PEZI|nr:hypothetical protein AC578_4232 [Pseudocercospora eumusae]
MREDALAYAGKGNFPADYPVKPKGKGKKLVALSMQEKNVRSGSRFVPYLTGPFSTGPQKPNLAAVSSLKIAGLGYEHICTTRSDEKALPGRSVSACLCAASNYFALASFSA